VAKYLSFSRHIAPFLFCYPYSDPGEINLNSVVGCRFFPYLSCAIMVWRNSAEFTADPIKLIIGSIPFVIFALIISSGRVLLISYPLALRSGLSRSYLQLVKETTIMDFTSWSI